MPECPTCGDTFDSERGMKSHHTQSHGTSLSKLTLSCDWCGDEFQRQQSLAAKSEKDFCSKGCSAQWTEHEQAPEDAPRWNGGKQTINCEWCSSEIERDPHRVEGTENNFCDAKCRGQWFSENQSGEQHHQFDSIVVHCETCGEELTRRRSRVEKTEHKFCSMGCRGEWFSKNVVGEDHPLWNGGPNYYGPTWRRQRRNALERDNHECQDCGMTREAHYDEHNTDLEVHHMTPFRTYADSAEANQLSNLITVCMDCHIKREHS